MLWLSTKGEEEVCISLLSASIIVITIHSGEVVMPLTSSNSRVSEVSICLTCTSSYVPKKRTEIKKKKLKKKKGSNGPIAMFRKNTAIDLSDL